MAEFKPYLTDYEKFLAMYGIDPESEKDLEPTNPEANRRMKKLRAKEAKRKERREKRKNKKNGGGFGTLQERYTSEE